MEAMRKHYDIFAAKEIGQATVYDYSDLYGREYRNETLYIPPEGNPFLLIEECGYGMASDQSVEEIMMTEAYEWVKRYCPEALTCFDGMDIPKFTQDFILVADFRTGVSGQIGYVHHAVFKAVDGSGYAVASNQLCIRDDCKQRYVAIKSVDGTEDIREKMYVNYMLPEDAHIWAEDYLPPAIYIKCLDTMKMPKN